MKKIGFLFLFFINFIVFGQQEPNLAKFKTIDQKLKAWLKYANEVDQADDYPKLILVATIGIALSKNHYAYTSKFYFLRGRGYEFNNNQNKIAVVNFELALKYAQKAKHLKNGTSA